MFSLPYKHLHLLNILLSSIRKTETGKIFNVHALKQLDLAKRQNNVLSSSRTKGTQMKVANIGNNIHKKTKQKNKGQQKMTLEPFFLVL